MAQIAQIYADQKGFAGERPGFGCFLGRGRVNYRLC